MTWLLIYKRDRRRFAIRIVVKKPFAMVKSYELFPLMKMWAYLWLKKEVQLHEIEIY